jgi:hypothetical protein
MIIGRATSQNKNKNKLWPKLVIGFFGFEEMSV